ncbi:MAG: PEP-CTERM sorting domain-containing protein [Marinobacter sp.]|uniref:PEP-CTERM sorting domain-containing protein n=1 Tax=Marinobacter sp. TaxID=50741 RepID=UPI00299E27CE|nr:PEP-CTERM sorting domain-containing protein [Marinobacter sp.]MDX1755306.1 PEP-CTERM sorting domain-containing protein [Marinobacter sp.]
MERVTQIAVTVALAVGLVGSASATKMTLAELGAQYTAVYEDANIDFSDGCVYFSCAGNLLVNGFGQEEQSTSPGDLFSDGVTAIAGVSERKQQPGPLDEIPTEIPYQDDNPETVTVTEPGTLALLALSIVGLVIARKKKSH